MIARLVLVILTSHSLGTSLHAQAQPMWWFDLIYSTDLCVVGAVTEKSGKSTVLSDGRMKPIAAYTEWHAKAERLIFSSIESMSIGGIVQINDDKAVLGEPSLRVLAKKRFMEVDGRVIELERYRVEPAKRVIILLKVARSEDLGAFEILDIVPMSDFQRISEALDRRVSMERRLMSAFSRASERQQVQPEGAEKQATKE